MNTAGREWSAYIAARNEIETAKALSASGGNRKLIPLGARGVFKPLSPEAELAETVKRQKEI